MSDDLKHIAEALAAFFPAAALGCKPGKVSGNRAMVIWYIDARDVMDRLDQVVGVARWQDEYDCLPDGCVVCRLSVWLNQDMVTKVDVGSPSEQPDDGDKRKAAFSDALKRAAVKFGVGRYLYAIPNAWADFDAQKKRFTVAPVPPKEFLPPPPKTTPTEKPKAAPAKAERPAPAKPGDPMTGAAFAVWLRDRDAEFAADELAPLGATMKHVNAQMVRADAKLGETTYEKWPPAQIKVAVQLTRDRWRELTAAREAPAQDVATALRPETRRRLEALVQEVLPEPWQRDAMLRRHNILTFADLDEQTAKDIVSELEEREAVEVKE